MLSSPSSATENLRGLTSNTSDLAPTLRVVYQQIFERQPYESERDRFILNLEKDFLRRRINLRRLIRQLGHSPLYQQLFFNPYANTRFIEVTFKHFLGRAPISRDEVAVYNEIINSPKQGIPALINALVDSDEYRREFGNDTVPHARERFSQFPPAAYLLSTKIHHLHLLTPMRESTLINCLRASGKG